ncbi:winged helix-turn-helix domain-containing protein [Streptomyces sp. NPDC056347]|uniref:winged helix-turn-helix domain-containing protein n=1 Tax=Streptomyces sp. NPDC056347 TaxID=3345790 RepID=UPI0035E0EAAE
MREEDHGRAAKGIPRRPPGNRLTIRFTFDDVMNVRLLKTAGPATESLFALASLATVGNRGEAEDAFAQWRRTVVFRPDRRHSRHLPLLTRMAQALAASPELMSVVRSPTGRITAWMEHPAGAAGVAAGRGMAANHRLAVALRAFAESAVQPYWPRIRSRLEHECEANGRAMATGGVEGLFGAIGSAGLHRNPPVLSVPSEHPGEVRLSGSGLLLAPSLFLTGAPRLFVDERKPENAPILVHPARTAVTTAALLRGGAGQETDRMAGRYGARSAGSVPSGSGAGEPQPLGSLVGSTRAAVLQALTVDLTTSELARHVGVTPGSASQHASVLRRAGLVSTTRTHTSAVHTLTPLGAALLRAPWLPPGLDDDVRA